MQREEQEARAAQSSLPQKRPLADGEAEDDAEEEEEDANDSE